MKKLLTLFTLLLTVCSGAWGDPTQTYDLTGYTGSAIANNGCTALNGAYVGRRGSTFTPNQTYGLATGSGSIAAVFAVNQNSTITIILNNQQTSAKSGTIYLASVSESYYTDCTNGTLGSFPSTKDAQSVAVSVIKNGNAGENEYTFSSSVEEGKYIVWWSSGIASNIYLSRIEVNAATPTCTTPTIAVDNTFNFEHKGYKVTITNKEGETLKVSTDGETYTTQTSPYVTYATTTTHYYAKSVKSSYVDSGVADENVTNTFDGEKKYIAWVYTKGYGVASYAFATDPMVIALQSIYNVVECDGGTSAPKNDWKNADLIVCTEAMQGNNNLSNGMVNLLDGTVPMIGLKVYNYGGSQTRWGWGTPANPSETVYGFTPKSNLYKLLDGITFENDGTIKLSTGRYNSEGQKNVVQTVEFNGKNKPADNVIMGNIDNNNDAKAVMHYSATKKYFGLGLSCDCWSYYTPNAITLVKNAAAMLIAGENLTTEVANVPVTIGTSGYASYCSSYALDFSTTDVKAYTAKVDKNEVKLTKIDNVPSGEGVILYCETPGTYNIPVMTSAGAVGDNEMVGVLVRTLVEWTTGGKYNYILQQGQFNKANDGYLKANRAYLSTTYNVDAPGAKPLTIVFNDEEQGEETDGIKSVQGSGFTVNGEAYNLSGQRVGADYKGIVIINGKKVIRK